MDKGDVGGAIVLIVAGLVLVLHRGVRDAISADMTGQQRGWVRLLPWLRGSDPWLASESTWRPFPIVAGIACIVGGLVLLSGASD